MFSLRRKGCARHMAIWARAMRLKALFFDAPDVEEAGTTDVFGVFKAAAAEASKLMDSPLLSSRFRSCSQGEDGESSSMRPSHAASSSWQELKMLRDSSRADAFGRGSRRQDSRSGWKRRLRS
ncbi:hypothetical protein MRX96_004285 [Rhipicephalus microplus]